MDRLHWILARFTERLGLAGTIAATAFVATITAFFMTWLPNKTRLAQIQTTPKIIESTVKTSSAQDQLNLFLTHFPKTSARVSSVQTIVDKAKSMGLGVDNISYKSDQPQDDRLSHYHVEFNLIGAYPQMRQFMATLMATMPYASLDTITMTRDDIGQDFIQTRVRLTLHFAA
jgi:hypothetical protein